MTKQIDFYFDVGSPNAYLAHFRLPEIVARTGAELIYRPMLLGGVFKATGNASPASIPVKGAYSRHISQRFVDRYKIPFQRNPDFPVNTMAMMRGAVAHQMKPEGDFMKFVDTCFHGMWVEPRNLNEPDILDAVLADAGFDVAQFRAWIGEQVVKDKLIEVTGKAVDRGVFGAPMFFVGEDMYFGQDMLGELERDIS